MSRAVLLAGMWRQPGFSPGSWSCEHLERAGSKSAEQNRTEPGKETLARQGARMKACECTSNPSNAGARRVSAGRRREVLFGALNAAGAAASIRPGNRRSAASLEEGLSPEHPRGLKGPLGCAVQLQPWSLLARRAPRL